MSLVVLRAGRGFRVGESQRVEFMPDKGQIEVDVQDGLARFCWKTRATASLEEELMLFPHDSKLERVHEEPTGRTFKLTFESSQAVHFFYLQSERSDVYKDKLVDTVNAIINDPENAASLPKLPTEASIRENSAQPQSMETD
ncbi:hypothetical protein E3P86_03815 [Wallemia ichthyophaga]|uniref:Pru domain-containing protein n=1 Tax=Wallemia ichthyophaga TaxID=245174 RepID=A0A4T0IKY1_WALIC|nr:hypothetical protein E3P86_03815 [Wallemia ichthyophaga]